MSFMYMRMNLGSIAQPLLRGMGQMKIALGTYTTPCYKEDDVEGEKSDDLSMDFPSLVSIESDDFDWYDGESICTEITFASECEENNAALEGKQKEESKDEEVAAMELVEVAANDQHQHAEEYDNEPIKRVHKQEDALQVARDRPNKQETVPQPTEEAEAIEGGDENQKSEAAVTVSMDNESEECAGKEEAAPELSNEERVESRGGEQQTSEVEPVEDHKAVEDESVQDQAHAKSSKNVVEELRNQETDEQEVEMVSEEEPVHATDEGVSDESSGGGNVDNLVEEYSAKKIVSGEDNSTLHESREVVSLIEDESVEDCVAENVEVAESKKEESIAQNTEVTDDLSQSEATTGGICHGEEQLPDSSPPEETFPFRVPLSTVSKKRTDNNRIKKEKPVWTKQVLKKTTYGEVIKNGRNLELPVTQIYNVAISKGLVGAKPEWANAGSKLKRVESNNKAPIAKSKPAWTKLAYGQGEDF